MRSRTFMPGIVVLAALLAVFCTVAPAAASDAAEPVAPALHPMPASPDLITRLGRARVAEIAGDAAPEKELYIIAEKNRAEGKSAQVTGTGSCLVILVEWTDHLADKTSHPTSLYDQMLFSTGVYPTGSMNDYYREISYGAYGVGGLVNPWIVDDDPYSAITPTDYGQVRDMFADVILQLDPVIDFSQYDNDGPDGVPDSGDDDGLVDALFFVHAGPGREATGSSNDIWSHAWSFYNTELMVDGVRCYSYSVEPEESPDGSMVTVGVFCHEYGHVLGLPDLYDTDYSTGGVGDWCLMSGGSWGYRSGDPAGSSPAHMTAWCKYKLGWIDPTPVTSASYGVTLPPAETSPTAYRIWRGGATGGDEYFLVENRRPIGFDACLVTRQVGYGLPQPEGMIIYHVDDALTSNSNERHRMVDVVEASPWFEAPGLWFEQMDGPRDYSTGARLDAYNRGDNGDVWPGFSAVNNDTTDWTGPRDRDRFADDTIPQAEDYYCDPTGVIIENIALSGQDVVADFLFASAKGEVAEAADMTVAWDFEDGVQGWQFCNSYVHLDQTQAGDCGGQGLWFGVDDPSFECGPGYGNGWYDITWRSVRVGGSPSVTLVHRYDLESGYDYGVVEARCLGDPMASWTVIGTVTGTSGCTEDTWTIPSSVLTECAVGGGAAEIDLRLRLETDGGYSAADGYFCGFGWYVDEVRLGGVLTGVDLPVPAASARLLPPWPNPFNPRTTIKYHVPADDGDATLRIYDQRGRLVRKLADGLPAGWGEAVWDGRDDSGAPLPSGVYFCRLRAGQSLEVRKLALLK